MSLTRVRSHSRKIGARRTKVKRHLRAVKKKQFKRGKPKLPFKKLRQVWNTTYIQDPDTGHMTGRKRVKGQGDKTGLLIDEKTYRIFGRIPKTK